jgi:lipoyl(octanoyl) transferase
MRLCETEPMDSLLVVRLGLVPYEEGVQVQRELERARATGEIPDTVLILEHPPVYTQGRRSRPAELPMGEDWYRMQGIEIVRTDRGGQLTYHGPGQLVAYPIVDLRSLDEPDDVHAFVRNMERAMIAALGDCGVEARVIDGLTGVWVGDQPPPAGDARKIGSIGIHVRRGITTHGLAVNVSNDLQPFEWVVPCGIEHCRMTSLTRELGAEQDVGEFATALVARLGEVFGREPAETAPEEVLGPLTLETA